MLNLVRRKLLILRGIRAANHQTSVLRWHIERLEDRSMLSAGPMSFGHGPGPAHGPSGLSNQHSTVSGAYAGQASNRNSYDPPLMRGDRGPGPAFATFQPQPMPNYFAPVMYEPGWSPYASPRPTMQAAKLSSSQPKNSLQTRANSPVSSNSPATSTSLLYRPVPPSEVFVVFVVPANNLSIFELDKLTPPPTPTGQTRPLQRSDPGIVGTVASVARNPLTSTPLAELPLVSQLLPRDSAPSPALALSAAIRDIVFQGYLPTSAAVIANAMTNDRASVIPVSKESGTPLAIDGFIQTSEDSLTDLSAVPGDVVTAEANAINDILRELRDVTSPAQLSPQMQPTVGLLNDADVANVTIDLQTDFSVDEVASIQLDGGMVALQSTGDANASSFDLSPMYAMQVESLAAPVPMEAAVGVYQAIDVAADDLPMTELQPLGATVTPQTEVQMQNSSPPKNDRGATHKAASLVGMTALTGAIVWMSRAREQAEHAQLEPSQAAQKRRVLSA